MQPERDPYDTPQPTSGQPMPNSPPTEQPVTAPRAPVVTLTPEAQPAASSAAWQSHTEPTSTTSNEMTMSTPGERAQGITTNQPAAPADEPLRWQGTEYVHHEKDTLWFVIFGIVVVVFMALAILLIKSPTFTVLIPVMAVALLVYARRPPRMIDYTLSSKGLFVNDQLYSFADFKGFGVIRDGREYSIMLIPTKRFRLGVSIYFPEEAGEAIVDMLGAYLPMQEMKLDMFDQIIHKLRI